MSSSEGPPDDLLALIADAHDEAFRQVTGKWRAYRGLVRTPAGGTFFPSEVRALAQAFTVLGLAGRVLEVGSGDGRLLSLLAHLRPAALPGIAEVVGVEVVPEYVEASRRARVLLEERIDYGATREICANVLEVDLAEFDVLLYFAGGAMPEAEDAKFREKLARELRPDARLVAWGPDAEEIDLPRLAAAPVPGYHTLHVYRGR